MFANVTINPYYLVDFSERDARTRRLAIVWGSPNYTSDNGFDLEVWQPERLQTKN